MEAKMRSAGARSTSSAARRVLVTIAVGSLPACGGSSPTAAPPPTTQPTPPPPSVVSQGNTALAVNTARGVFFTTSRAGTLDTTVDYTFADSNIVVWIARGQCT